MGRTRLCGARAGKSAGPARTSACATFGEWNLECWNTGNSVRFLCNSDVTGTANCRDRERRRALLIPGM
jgi:hypothetical protein